MALMTKAGTGTMAGLRRALPNASLSSLKVIGFGAVALTGPSYSSFSMASTMSCTKSCLWIQLTGCVPRPMGPPPPNAKIGVMEPRAPPSLSSTTPILKFTTLVESLAAPFAADSH